MGIDNPEKRLASWTVESADFPNCLGSCEHSESGRSSFITTNDYGKLSATELCNMDFHNTNRSVSQVAVIVNKGGSCMLFLSQIWNSQIMITHLRSLCPYLTNPGVILCLGVS